jgi:hypothetical protein
MKKLSTAFLISMMYVSSFASTYNVTNTNSSGAGSLKQAIISANANSSSPHTIVASGISGTIILDSTLLIKQSMTITGPSTGGLNISGDNAYRIMDIQSNLRVSLENLVFQNGQISFGGAAISTFGTTTISNCSFINNKIVGGTGQGGAIWSNGGPLTVSGCTFSGNQSTANTGGAVALYGTGAFTNCTFYGNTSNDGGAVFNYGTSGTFINCTFTANTPNAISTDGVNTKLFLVNDIITGNTSTQVSGKMSAQNCIFGDVPSVNITSGTNNQVSVIASLVFGTATLADNGGLTKTIKILKPGLAANAGTSGSGAPSIDQRGETRDSQIDIGAYEETSDISAIADESMSSGVITGANPSQGKYVVELTNTDTKNTKWFITDQQGKAVAEGFINSSSFEVDITDKHSGIYHLTIQTGGHSVSHKLVKY